LLGLLQLLSPKVKEPTAVTDNPAPTAEDSKPKVKNILSGKKTSVKAGKAALAVKSKAVKCPECARVLNRDDALKNHLIVIHGLVPLHRDFSGKTGVYYPGCTLREVTEEEKIVCRREQSKYQLPSWKVRKTFYIN